MHSFLLIGQSNMAGRGFLSDAHEIDISHIYTLRNGRWQQMFRPINPDRITSGVSLAESFAESYAKKHGKDVGLICCADGGTSLDQWQPGGVLFEHAVMQAKLAMRSSRLVGVLWHQGEADCSAENANTYPQRFENLMKTLRAELDMPDLPFILGGLGDFLPQRTFDADLQNYQQVNLALRLIAADDPMCAFAEAEGLLSNPDHLHFCADALYEFGLRYFAAFESLCVVSDSASVAADLTRSAMELL